MTTSPFASPASSTGGIDLDTVLGSLLLVEVLGQEHDVHTVHGLANPVRANVAVLDGENKGDTYDDVLIFPRVLISQLKSRVGAKVLGRLGKGVAKAGQSAPWVLQEATPEDQEIGVAYLATQMSTPATNDAPF